MTEKPSELSLAAQFPSPLRKILILKRFCTVINVAVMVVWSRQTVCEFADTYMSGSLIC